VEFKTMNVADREQAGSDRELRLEAMQIVLLLPTDSGEALRVLSMAHQLLVGFVETGEMTPRVVPFVIRS
jgi:hypothetical protein